MDTNPYAPPAENSLPPSLPGSSATLSSDVLFFRDGDFLVVRDGAELPAVCVRTNQRAGEGSWRKKVTIAWSSPWVFALILINILVVIIVMLVTQKKAKIIYSLSAEARAAIVNKRSIGFFLLVATVGLFVVAGMWANDLAGFAILGGVVSLIASLVFFIIANPIKVAKYHDGWFRIKGCSKEFLASLAVQY